MNCTTSIKLLKFSCWPIALLFRLRETTGPQWVITITSNRWRLATTIFCFGRVKNRRKTFCKCMRWSIPQSCQGLEYCWQSMHVRNRQHSQHGSCCKNPAISTSPLHSPRYTTSYHCSFSGGWIRRAKLWDVLNTALQTELRAQQAAQQLKVESLAQDVLTQWNSTLDMIKRIKCNKESLQTTLAQQKHNLAPLTPAEYDKLAKLETLLEPCRWGVIAILLSLFLYSLI